MAEPREGEAREEIERIARAVIAGEETIEVPQVLTEEKVERQPAAPDTPISHSLWAQIQAMTVAQQVKLALKGNKDARSILIRSTNRMIQRMVLQNPRITEDEILSLAKNRNSDEEVLRIIAEAREWTGLYQVRTALVENARTPLTHALRLIRTLADRELRALAKSKNVPQVIASQARKVLFNKESVR